MKLASLPVGATLTDGPGHSFLVAGQRENGYPGTILVTEHVVAMMPFDTPREDYEDKEQRRFGSNSFPGSDLDQWLNSEEGFRGELSDTLKNNILTVQMPYAGMGQQEGFLEASIFIPSVAELGLEVDDHVKEGSELSLFREFRMRYAMPSPALVQKRPPDFGVLDENDTWCYWLRTAHPTHGSILYTSHSHSPYAFCEAYRDYVGVRPMLVVNDNMEITESKKGGTI